MNKRLKEQASLFVSDEELRQQLCPRVSLRRFRTTLRALELRKFPKINHAFGGRYFPAVRAWLDSEHGLNQNLSLPPVEDGEEHWPDAEQKL